MPTWSRIRALAREKLRSRRAKLREEEEGEFSRCDSCSSGAGSSVSSASRDVASRPTAGASQLWQVVQLILDDSSFPTVPFWTRQDLPGCCMEGGRLRLPRRPYDLAVAERGEGAVRVRFLHEASGQLLRAGSLCAFVDRQWWAREMRGCGVGWSEFASAPSHVFSAGLGIRLGLLELPRSVLPRPQPLVDEGVLKRPKRLPRAQPSELFCVLDEDRVWPMGEPKKGAHQVGGTMASFVMARRA